MCVCVCVCVRVCAYEVRRGVIYESKWLWGEVLHYYLRYYKVNHSHRDNGCGSPVHVVCGENLDTPLRLTIA